MRHAVIVLLVTGVLLPIHAQSPRPDEVAHRARMLEIQFRELDGEVRLLAQGLRRDAFIVVQLMAAAKELTDFQQQVALQKAADRIDAATRKAAAKPEADRRTTMVLSRLGEAIEKARDQGLSADVMAVRAVILRGAGDIQHLLFLDLDDLRTVRKLYGDMHTKNGQTIVDFDDAMAESLGAALGMLEVKVTE